MNSEFILTKNWWSQPITDARELLLQSKAETAGTGTRARRET